MATDVVELPVTGSIREFMNIPAGQPNAGFRLRGTCGQTAVECAVAAVLGRKPTQSDMYKIYKDMHVNKKCDLSGASTMEELVWEVERMGIKILKHIDFENPLNSDSFTADIRANAGVNPIVIEVARAYNLRDVETKAADEAGVEFHYIAILGKQKDGYICADGDNPEAGSRMQVYSLSTLLAAHPCAFMMLEMNGVEQVASVLDVSKVSKYFSQVSATLWKCSNGFSIGDSMLVYYRSLPGPAMTFGVLPFVGLPLSSKNYVGSVAYQLFERGVIIYDPNRTFDNPPGASGDCYLGKVNDPRVVALLTPDLQKQLSDQAIQIIALQKQTQPADPQGQQAISILRSMKSFFNQI